MEWGCSRCENCPNCINRDCDQAICDSEELAWPSEESEEYGQENSIVDLTRSNAGVWIDQTAYRQYQEKNRSPKKNRIILEKKEKNKD